MGWSVHQEWGDLSIRNGVIYLRLKIHFTCMEMSAKSGVICPSGMGWFVHQEWGDVFKIKNTFHIYMEMTIKNFWHFCLSKFQLLFAPTKCVPNTDMSGPPWRGPLCHGLSGLCTRARGMRLSMSNQTMQSKFLIKLLTLSLWNLICTLRFPWCVLVLKSEIVHQ